MSNIQAYNGSAWVNAIPKYWDGSAWVALDAKYWTGSEWSLFLKAIPAGLIIPFKGTTIPSNWSIFTDADGKLIIGAGNTYAAKDTGGNNSLTTITSANGAHSGTSATDYFSKNTTVVTGTGNFYYNAPSNAQDDHTHTVTIAYSPEHQDLKLIKADINLPEFPADAVILTSSNVNPGSLTPVYDANKIMGINSTVSLVAESLSVISISDEGEHDHGGSLQINDNVHNITSYHEPADGADAGEHDHADTVNSLTISAEAIKKAYLRAWTDSAAFRDSTDVIALWEGSTPPADWILCDGNNGTMDLRDYFICLSSSGNVGTMAGDNTVTATGSLPSDGDHNHQTGSLCSNTSVSGYHSDTVGAHTHNLAGTSSSYTPEYYALTFIQYSP